MKSYAPLMSMAFLVTAVVIAVQGAHAMSSAEFGFLSAVLGVLELARFVALAMNDVRAGRDTRHW